MFDERGVSEVVGFVIVFGLIIGSVGILYVSGFSAMEDFQEGEQTKNAERALDAMAENFNDIQRNDGINTRSSELNLRGGTIQTDTNETNMTLTVREGGVEIYDNELSLGAFTYEHDGAKFAYHGGGVFRETEEGGFAVRDPPIKCKDDNRAIVSLAVVEGDDVRVMASGGREITASKQGKAEVYTGDEVDITIEDSTFDDGWDRFLDDWGENGDYSCGEEDEGHVVVRITTINISYD